MAAYPAPCSFVNRHGPRPDRLVLEEALEILGQLERSRISLARLLAKTLQADRLEVTGHARLERGHGDRLVVEHAEHRLEGRPADERRPSRQELIEHGPEGV